MNEPKFLIPAAERIRQFAEYVEFRGSVLDVGTGSGIIAELAIRKGAHDVTAIDINQDAVDHVRRTRPHINAFYSDLFENVTGKFDTIVFAAPWSEGEINKPFDYALYDRGFVERFLLDVSHYLMPGGRVWLQYCDAFPRKFNALPGWIRAGGLRTTAEWHYETYGAKVKHNVRVFLYRIEPLREDRRP